MISKSTAQHRPQSQPITFRKLIWRNLPVEQYSKLCQLREDLAKRAQS